MSGIDAELERLERELRQDPSRLELYEALSRGWRRAGRTLEGRPLEAWGRDLNSDLAPRREAAVRVLSGAGPAAIPTIMKAFEADAEGAREILRSMGQAARPHLEALLRTPGRRRAYEAHRLLRRLITDRHELLPLALAMARDGDRLRRSLAFDLLDEVGEAALPELDVIAGFLDPDNRFEVRWLVDLVRPALGGDLCAGATRLAPFERNPKLRRTFVEVAFAEAVRGRCEVPNEAVQVLLEEWPLRGWGRLCADEGMLQATLEDLRERSSEILERRLRARRIHGLELFSQLTHLEDAGRRVLLRLIRAPDSWLRETAMRELSLLPHCDEITAALEDGLHDEAWVVRLRSREALDRLERG